MVFEGKVLEVYVFIFCSVSFRLPVNKILFSGSDEVLGSVYVWVHFAGLDRVNHKLFSKKYVFWNTDCKIYFNTRALYQKLIFRSFKYLNLKLQLLSASCFSVMIKKLPASAVLQWLYKNLVLIVLQFKTSF